MRKRRTLAIIGIALLVAMLSICFASCAQNIGSGSDEDAIDLIERGYETAKGYTTFYWKANIKNKTEFTNEKGNALYDGGEIDSRYNTTNEAETKGYFWSKVEEYARDENGDLTTKLTEEELWYGKYAEKSGEEKKQILLAKINATDVETQAAYEIVEPANLFNMGVLEKYSLTNILDVVKDFWANSDFYTIVSKTKVGVVNNIVLKMKGELEGFGHLQITVLDVVDETKKQTTMLSSITNEFETDSEYYAADLDSYLTFTFLSAGPKIADATSDSAEEWVELTLNPPVEEKSYLVVILIGVAVGVILILLVIYFARKKARKKKHAEFLARKEAENNSGNTPTDAEVSATVAEESIAEEQVEAKTEEAKPKAKKPAEKAEGVATEVKDTPAKKTTAKPKADDKKD